MKWCKAGDTRVTEGGIDFLDSRISDIPFGIDRSRRLVLVFDTRNYSETVDGVGGVPVELVVVSSRGC